MAQQQDKANDHGTHQSGSATATRTYGADDIARRAYLRFLDRGRVHGHDMDDWFAAERELQAQGAGETSTPPHGDELASAPGQAPVASRAKAKGARAKKGPNPHRPDRASDQQ